MNYGNNIYKAFTGIKITCITAVNNEVGCRLIIMWADLLDSATKAPLPLGLFPSFGSGSTQTSLISIPTWKLWDSAGNTRAWTGWEVVSGLSLALGLCEMTNAKHSTTERTQYSVLSTQPGIRVPTVYNINMCIYFLEKNALFITNTSFFFQRPLITRQKQEILPSESFVSWNICITFLVPDWYRKF